MPPAEPNNAARSCDRHPSSEAVATCDGCGRPMCVRCAVPVRGQAFGDECLAELLGPDLQPAPVPPARWRKPRMPWVGAGFAIATLASLLPWQRFGQGSGALGAYGLIPRYSLFCALIAIAGLVLWASVSVRTWRAGRWWLPTVRVCAALVVLTAILHITRPPSIGPPSIGPWIAIAGGLLAIATSWSSRDLPTRS